MTSADPHRERVPAILIDGFTDRDDAAREAARRWADHASLERVSDGASFTYRFATGAQRRYLRVVPPSWRSRAELEGELAFIDHLATNGIPLAVPIASASGERIISVETAIGECLALVTDEVPGIATDDSEWTAEQAREVGALMARMHIATRGFVLPAGTTRLSWRDEMLGLRGELEDDEAPLVRIVDESEALFASLPRTPDVYGVVHFDLSGDNIVWRGLDATAIDFDDCMHTWYVADIARTAATLRSNNNGREAAVERAFLDGYEAVRPLDQQWRDLLPAFIRFMLICELAWMLDASDTVPGRVTFDHAAESRLRGLIG
jgi:Ser/Thr protein kinase RdoA (MazF antagonist)